MTTDALKSSDSENALTVWLGMLQLKVGIALSLATIQITIKATRTIATDAFIAGHHQIGSCIITGKDQTFN